MGEESKPAANTPETDRQNPAASNQHVATHPDDEHLIADGVDEEPVESNRRLFEGKAFVFVATLAGLYALFHMLALNGVSIGSLTGGVIDPWFLPTFPMETWNFRIVHVAGALAIGFIMFSGARNCPCFRFRTLPVLAASSTRWVCMQR